MLPVIVDIPALNIALVFFLAGLGWAGGVGVMGWLLGKVRRQ